MRSALLIGVIALGSLAGSSFAQGQRAAVSVGQAAPPVAHPAPARPSAPRAANNHRSAPLASTAVVRPGNSKPISRDVDALGASTMAPRLVGPVSPGGFINPANGTNRVHRKSKNNNGANEIIIFGGGYGYGYVPDDSQLQGQEQTQEGGQEQADGQQSGGQQELSNAVTEQGPDLRAKQPPSASDQAGAAETQPATPLRDVGSFTLVTRGGYRLDAVAFTRSNDRLVYITPDGGRRSIAVRDLDLDSTQRLNQELGTPVEIPSDEAPASKPKSKPAAGMN
jgi:hypothetical protein